MNEFYAVEPACISTASELRLLLMHFGPYAGRYLAAFPDSWVRDVEQRSLAWGEMEMARAKTLLRRALERSSILVNPAMNWNAADSWMQNVLDQLSNRPKRLDGAIVNSQRQTPHASLHTFDGLDLPPTAEERVLATPEEFERVCRTILLISPELIMVDPFLNICDRCVFRHIAATDSGAMLPPVPGQCCHPFRTNAATP